MEDGRESVVAVKGGASLLDAAKEAGVAIDAPCAGNGSCGKCRVRLADGTLGGERGRHLSEEAFERGDRLACLSEVVGDVVIDVPEAASAFQTRIRVADLSEPREQAAFETFREELAALGLGVWSGLELLEISLEAPTLEDAQADRERLLRALSAQEGIPEAQIEIGLGALRSLPNALRDGGFRVWLTVRRGQGSLRVLYASAEASPPIGAAIDIGTTTVSAVLADLSTGEILAAGNAGNAQIRYGADVINRLIESARPGGLARLRAAVCGECLAPLLAELCARIGREGEAVCRVAVAGNTTMMHLLLGIYGNHLRMEPYVPAFFDAEGLRGADIGIGVNPDAHVDVAPSVGSYVGGDISAGALSSMIFRKEGLTCFIDLGTNGEIVLGNSDFLLTCACSAGPAFEGGDIRCGMRATDGAIEAIAIDEESMEPTLTVIGAPGQAPVGLCGSGLIDLIGELFRCGIIDARGRFARTGSRVRTDEWGISFYVLADAETSGTGYEISVGDADIENFIRAKGAIFSAIRTMLLMTDMTTDMLEGVYIAGGIGSGIDIAQAVRIGMLPAIPEELYHYIGNTSLSGAYAMLTGGGAADEVRRIASGMTYIELSSWPGYMDEFIAACFLPHTDAGLFRV
jgi:uncharacterized 2Fe-2S/4Fe-4S cluster protein (DUF4445 family)